MLYRQLFFISGRLVAESQAAGKPLGDDYEYPPSSRLFYCRFCGDAFARVVNLRPNGDTTPWIAYALCCPKCTALASPIFDVPGSILIEDQEYFQSLPEPVLERETMLHIDNFERIYHGNEKASATA